MRREQNRGKEKPEKRRKGEKRRGGGERRRGETKRGETKRGKEGMSRRGKRKRRDIEEDRRRKFTKNMKSQRNHQVSIRVQNVTFPNQTLGLIQKPSQKKIEKKRRQSGRKGREGKNRRNKERGKKEKKEKREKRKKKRRREKRKTYQREHLLVFALTVSTELPDFFLSLPTSSLHGLGFGCEKGKREE